MTHQTLVTYATLLCNLLRNKVPCCAAMSNGAATKCAIIGRHHVLQQGKLRQASVSSCTLTPSIPYQ